MSTPMEPSPGNETITSRFACTSPLTGDDEPQVRIRSTTYALAIEGLAHDRVVVQMQPDIYPESAQPRVVSDDDMRKVERLLAQAWDIIDPQD